MTVLIAATALLCGVSIGAVIGTLLAWRWFNRAPEDEPKIEDWGV